MAGLAGRRSPLNCNLDQCFIVGTSVAVEQGTKKHRQRAKQHLERRNEMETEKQNETCTNEEPCILEEIQVEELAIDGICGVY
jgi:mycofactocin precursor